MTRLRVVVEGDTGDASYAPDVVAALHDVAFDWLADVTVDHELLTDAKAADDDERGRAARDRELADREALEAVEGDPADIEANPRAQPWPSEQWHRDDDW